MLLHFRRPFQNNNISPFPFQPIVYVSRTLRRTICRNDMKLTTKAEFIIYKSIKTMFVDENGPINSLVADLSYFVQ